MQGLLYVSFILILSTAKRTASPWILRLADTSTQPKKRKAAVDVAQRDTARIDAAVLVAERNVDDDAESLTDSQIASRVGVSRRTLMRWKNDHEFQAFVADAEGQIRARALRVPTAQVHHRIKSLDKIAQGILKAIALRAETYSVRADTLEEAARAMFGSDTPPWAGTGLFIEKKKIAANGKTVTDWELDTASVNTLKGIYEHVAKQLGQLDDTVNINHTVNDLRDEKYESASVETLERIAEFLSGDA